MKTTLKPARPSSFRLLEIKSSWGVITLTLKDGRPVALDLPPLKTAPRKEFSFIGGTRPLGAFRACAERPLHLNK